MQKPEQLFKALGDETRLRLIYLLISSGRTLCVCEMMEALGLPQYQASRHLSVLKNAGLATCQRRGTWMYYSLDIETPGNKALFEFLENWLQTFYSEGAFAKDIKRLRKHIC